MSVPSKQICAEVVVPEDDSARVKSIEVRGELLQLFADRAVYWRSAQTLLIADPHFGKAAAFRAGGVPVPPGTTKANLDRLSALLDMTGAVRLIVLGDFFHASTGRVEQTLEFMSQWRQQQRSLHIVLVRGNHDQHAGDPPQEWNICCVDEPMIEGPFEFRHQPIAARSFAIDQSFDRFILAGHVHPCAILRDHDGSTMRLSCFHLSGQQMIVPAFGAFTGMHPIRPVRGDRVFAVGRETIFQVPALENR